MTSVKVSFIKKKFASIASAQTASVATQGVIVFDKSNKVICVDGDVYGGNIQDVSYDNETNVLTITRVDGVTQTLSFADVASASATMAVFGQLRDTIGVSDSDQQVQEHYSNTNYLQGAQTLIDADKKLDTQIHIVQGNLDALQGSLANVAFTGKAEDVVVDPITYGGVTLQGPDGNTAGNVQDALEGIVRGIIDSEQVTEAAFEAIQGSIGLDKNFTFIPHTGAHYIQGSTNVDHALTDLDNAIHNISSSGEITVVTRTTAEAGYVKSYDIYQGDTTDPTNLKGTINIPKDFLVKSASVQIVTTPDDPYTGAQVGDKYIDFIINVKEGTSPADEHIYLPVNELVDVYTVAQGATAVQLAIDSNNVISASLVDGGVTTSKIAAQGVTSEKIAAQGVEGWNIKDGTITSNKLAQDVVVLPQDNKVIVNNDTTGYNGTTIANVAGKDIKVDAVLYWAEWSDDEHSYFIPFYVENISDEAETLSIKTQNNDSLNITVEYSTDGNNWSTLGVTSTTPLTYALSPGDKLYLRANTNTWYESWDLYENFCSIGGVSKVGGNIMSLIYGSSFTGNETRFPNGSAFNLDSLFYGNINLISASDLILPATTLTGWCYGSMFSGCTSLTNAPELPATTLASGCYEYMFQGCTSLTTAPELPATTLAESCYYNMFFSCTSLTTAPELPATTLAESCYFDMFNGCTSLTTAPELPAIVLVNNCYQQMFYGCTTLNQIKCLATDISANYCTLEWIFDVASTGTFIKNTNMSSWTTGNNGIPSGWTVQDAA